jgi:D-alanyl-D-alanine carboxypeptidase
LKTAQEFVQMCQDLRGGMTLRVYLVKFAEKTLRAWTYEMPDGKLEQYQIAPEDWEAVGTPPGNSFENCGS